MPLVHLFLSFFKAHEASRKIPVGLTRDGLPAWLVTAALLRFGFGMGEVRLNYPPPPGREREFLEIDRSGLRAGDVVLTSTRDPADDAVEGGVKTIPTGYTSLERDTDRVWKLYIQEVTREFMTLQPWLRAKMRTNYEDRREVEFMQRERAHYKTLNACDGSGARKVSGLGRTAAFLVNQPELWPGGPGYLGFFGIDGAATLAWAYLLQQRHADLLVRPGFHMVELTTRPIPERVPDLRWALDWKSEILLSVPPATLPPSETTPAGPRKTFSGQGIRDQLRA